MISKYERGIRKLVFIPHPYRQKVLAELKYL
jgi:hypothetical protein